MNCDNHRLFYSHFPKICYHMQMMKEDMLINPNSWDSKQASGSVKWSYTKATFFWSHCLIQGYSSQVSIVLAYLYSLYMEQSWNPSTWQEPTWLEIFWCILTLGKWKITPVYHAMKFGADFRNLSSFLSFMRISLSLPLNRWVGECSTGCLIQISCPNDLWNQNKVL